MILSTGSNSTASITFTNRFSLRIVGIYRTDKRYLFLSVHRMIMFVLCRDRVSRDNNVTTCFCDYRFESRKIVGRRPFLNNNALYIAITQTDSGGVTVTYGAHF